MLVYHKCCVKPNHVQTILPWACTENPCPSCTVLLCGADTSHTSYRKSGGFFGTFTQVNKPFRTVLWNTPAQSLRPNAELRHPEGLDSPASSPTLALTIRWSSPMYFKYGGLCPSPKLKQEHLHSLRCLSLPHHFNSWPPKAVPLGSILAIVGSFGTTESSGASGLIQTTPHQQRERSGMDVTRPPAPPTMFAGDTSTERKRPGRRKYRRFRRASSWESVGTTISLRKQWHLPLAVWGLDSQCCRPKLKEGAV